MEQSSTLVQNWLVNPVSVMPLFYQGTHLAWSVSIKSMQVGNSTNGFSPLLAYRVPSGTMKTRQQGGSFQVSSGWFLKEISLFFFEWGGSVFWLTVSEGES